MKTIETKNAPGAIGPYSQAYQAGSLIITSGQLPADPETGVIPEGIEAQAEQTQCAGYSGSRRGWHGSRDQDHLLSCQYV